MSTRLPRRTVRGFGWRRGLPDFRDYRFLAPRSVRTPSHVDLRISLAMPTKVWDQGDYGSCTAHAVGAALLFSHNAVTKATDPDAFMPSRFFIYRGERVIEGDPAQDNGAEIRDGFKVIAKLGAPDESRYPYDAAHFNKAPSKSVLANAAKHQATQYNRIDNSTSAGTLQALALGYAVAFGFTVFESFEGDVVSQSGVVPMPVKDEEVLGGHAVLAVGYDKRYRRLIVRNSWGPDWGKGGYFTMPFDYAFNTDLADDFWICKAAE